MKPRNVANGFIFDWLYFLNDCIGNKIIKKKQYKVEHDKLIKIQINKQIDRQTK